MTSLKQSLRNNLKATMLNLSHAKQAASISAIGNKLLPLLTSWQIIEVGVYMPMPHEINIKPIIDQLFTAGYKLSLPCTFEKLAPLIFKRYHPDDILRQNSRYAALLEPNEDCELILPQVVITPLLAFDRQLRRLGHGKGFYDYTFAYYNQQKIPVYKVGLALELQKIAAVPVEMHDINLDIIITEENIYEQRKRKKD